MNAVDELDEAYEFSSVGSKVSVSHVSIGIFDDASILIETRDPVTVIPPRLLEDVSFGTALIGHTATLHGYKELSRNRHGYVLKMAVVYGRMSPTMLGQIVRLCRCVSGSFSDFSVDKRFLQPGTMVQADLWP
jgi:hypothetical protein